MTPGILLVVMAADDGSPNRLISLYRRYVGEPERATDVYLGFALFFGGIALGLIGFGAFLWSVTLPDGAALFWPLREIAISMAFLGLPSFILSVVVLLPVSRRVLAASSAGALLCLVAVAVFVAVYPDHWNVQVGADYSAQGIAVYAGGLALLVASTGSALVAHHLEQARPQPAGESDVSGSGSATGDSTETVTDEQVQRDIEDAVADADITWGGVQKTKSKRLTITTDDVPEVDSRSFGPDKANTVRSGGVDDAVAGLRQLQGGNREEATGSGVDEQTAALQDLRDRQAAQEEEQPSTIGRVRDRLGL